MRIKIMTLIFTEACPLHCRYCFLERDTYYGLFDAYKEKEIWDACDNFYKGLKEDDVGRICFSGGEPLLYWSYIQKIILHYGDKMIFEFNTSAYPLTLEMLEFLSHYQVIFNLSVDGGEKFANWRRPVKEISGGAGYYKKVKEILPALLYYFPDTRYKIIVPKRCIDLVHEQYLEGERMGFRLIDFVIDLNERYTSTVYKNTQPTGDIWAEEDYVAFSEQMARIGVEIAKGLSFGIERAHVVGIDNCLKGLLCKDDILLPACRVLDGRCATPLNQEERFCLSSVGIPDRDAANKIFFDELKAKNMKCSRNPDCVLYKGCLFGSCLQDNLAETGKATDISVDVCGFYSGFGRAAINILEFGNQFGKKGFYQNWLYQYMEGGLPINASANLE